MMNDELSQRIDEIDRLRDSGDLAGALALYEAVSRDVPDVVTGPYKEGVVLARMGRVAEAEQRYRDALLLDENFPEALNNLALLLVARGEWDEAERCFRRALAEKPEFFEASIGFANLLWTAWRTLESLFFARRAISLKPDSAKAYERVGTCLRRLGRIREALAALIRATELGPEVASCWMELAGCLQHLGRHDEADAAYDKAVEVAGTSNIPLSNSAYFSNLIDIPREQAWQRHRTFGLWAREQLGPVAAAPRLRPKPDRRLRVGFVSADFRRHSVAYFVRGALERLDRSQFQLFAYFDSHREDDVSAWLKPIFHHWRDIFAMQHEAVIEQVREDRIDILVDLSGHTGTNRNMLFARRAAPLQLNYLGYPNTTGLDTMDYRLTDVWADPEGDGDEFHSETLWRLQRCFLCYAPPDSTPAVDPGVRGADEPVVFGSFNSRVKISAACAAAWAKLLQRVPHSRLVLKSVSGTEDEESREGLRQQFVTHGISAERIEVCKSDDSLDGHLEHYAVIDVALDTFPYNGTTTTCEALWMGVPVVSLAGDRHAARVGHSLLSSVGLDELVARSVDEYIHIAVELSADKKRLTDLRASMRDRVKASPLLDRRAMGQALGHALRGMWQRHCDSFDAEVPLEDDHVDVPEVIRLHIGGQEIKEGWKIFDITARPEVDFVGDLRDLSAFAEGSCAEVYASHVLEHVPPQDILMVLNGIHRILVPGGTLYLAVPNLDILSWLFSNPAASNAEKFYIMRVIFGGQLDENDLHRIGLNLDFMVDYLTDVGFTSVEQVQSFGLFSDDSEQSINDHRVSLNMVVIK